MRLDYLFLLMATETRGFCCLRTRKTGCFSLFQEPEHMLPDGVLCSSSKIVFDEVLRVMLYIKMDLASRLRCRTWTWRVSFRIFVWWCTYTMTRRM
jgi:hypothetical protein